jgi:hypothetical protein
MDDISYNDLERMYLYTLVSYDGVFYYVTNITRGKELVLKNPLTNSVRTVPFNRESFVSPGNIGFVNKGKNCLYLTRIPRRIYYIGVNLDNLRIKVLGNDRYEFRIDDPSIVYALNDLYPTLEEALDLIKKGHTHVAFNKQFAVDKFTQLYYKTTVVGCVVNGKCVFNPGKEFLANLFRTQDVKNLRKKG